MSTPKRPGPAAYVSLGALTALSFVPLVVRTVTSVLDIALGHALNLALFVALTVLMAAAGALTATLIVRYFRACRAEDQAETAALRQRMEEVEEQHWWGKPTGAEDTIELGSNVHPLRKPPSPEKRRSS